MNETLEADQTTLTAAARLNPGLYERLVVNALEKMNAGFLRMEMPDGEVKTIGKPGAAISATMRVRDAAFFPKCVLFGDVGFGESYVDGDWETDSIERVIAWAIHNVENSPSMSGSTTRAFALNLFKFYNRTLHLVRPNSVGISRRNIAEHYDLGNDFYRLWLDETMTYSSARFTSPGQSLRDAQIEISVGRVNQALNRTGDLFLHHFEDLGSSYARTLHVWWESFNAQLGEVRALGFDDRFIRKWNYYFQYCEAAFASRNISVVQAVYTRPKNRTLHTGF